MQISGQDDGFSSAIYVHEGMQILVSTVECKYSSRSRRIYNDKICVCQGSNRSPSYSLTIAPVLHFHIIMQSVVKTLDSPRPSISVEACRSSSRGLFFDHR